MTKRIVAQGILSDGDQVIGLGIHEVVQVAVVIAVLHILAVHIGAFELGGRVKGGLGHAAGDDVFHLGADKGRALTGLDVLELDHLHDLTIHLEGHAVAEITGSNRRHWYSSSKTRFRIF